MSDSTTFYPELYDGGIRAAVTDFGLISSNSGVIEVQVKATSYANGTLVVQRYSTTTAEGNSKHCYQQSVLLLLQGKTATWVPELCVYEIDKNSSDKLICESLDKVNYYVGLTFPL